jgi:hypothetical protein
LPGVGLDEGGAVVQADGVLFGAAAERAADKRARDGVQNGCARLIGTAGGAFKDLSQSAFAGRLSRLDVQGRCAANIKRRACAAPGLFAETASRRESGYSVVEVSWPFGPATARPAMPPAFSLLRLAQRRRSPLDRFS